VVDRVCILVYKLWIFLRFVSKNFPFFHFSKYRKRGYLFSNKINILTVPKTSP
jgi:hypothetical protein